MASFFAELKRRNVFKVGVAYAIVAWLIAQIVAVVSTPLHLPDWFDTAVILLLIIGFPIALLFAWAFELTPEGIKSTKSVAPYESITQSTGQKLNFIIIGLLAVAVIFLFVDRYLPRQGDQSPSIVTEGQRLPNSVAILPCTNLSTDPDKAYIAMGIHESMINQLAKIRDMAVLSRTSVMQYENNPPPIPEIAESLNVEMVMECSVQYADERVLITAQLIDGFTDAHIWADSYDDELTDIFSVQAEIAQNIASALQAEILPEELQRIQKIQTNSPEALELYLQARNIPITPGGVGPRDDLHSLLDQAINLDPGFAAAYALKAFDYAYAIIRDKAQDDPDVEELKYLVLEYIGNALALNPEENLAYSALAYLYRNHWQIEMASGAFETALKLAPNDVYSLLSYQSFLSFLGEYERGTELGLRAHELEPIRSGHARAYMDVGDFEEAYLAWLELQQIDPFNAYNYYMQAITEWHRGNSASAYMNIEKAEELFFSQEPSRPSIDLIHTYGVLERPEDAQRLFIRLEQYSESNHISAIDWARAYLGIRDLAKTKFWLNKIAAERNPEDTLSTMSSIIGNRSHDPILDQPEFIEIRNRLRKR